MFTSLCWWSWGRKFVYNLQTFWGFFQVHFYDFVANIIQHENFLPTSQHRQAKVRCSLGICWSTASFIAQISSSENVSKWDEKTELLPKNTARHHELEHNLKDVSFVIRSTSLFFNEYLRRRETICHFHVRAIARRRKAWFYFRMSGIIFSAKHSWTRLCMSRPLFVGSYLQVTWWALG